MKTPKYYDKKIRLEGEVLYYKKSIKRYENKIKKIKERIAALEEKVKF